jgi:nicotinate-nucleotide pyrophosphorylase (carboxylating)
MMAGRRKFPFRVRIPETYLERTISAALDEDRAYDDLASRLAVGRCAEARARLVLREGGVVAGLEVFRAVFGTFDPAVAVTLGPAKEGRRSRRGTVLAVVEGNARSVLACERVALNFVQRMSGIATLTAKFVERVKGTGVKVLDTRKTTPNLRIFEKYAVAAGGGWNHRLTLADLAIIKDNHVAIAGGIRQAAARIRRAQPRALVEIEVDPETDLEVLEDLNADILMFDNWEPREVGRAIRRVRRFPSKPLVEVSGRMRLENIRKYALAGPDFISVGCLTHSAPALDIGLDFTGASAA